MTITIVLAVMRGKPAYKATLVTSKGKIFNWHVYAEDFASIERQAIAYEESEKVA